MKTCLLLLATVLLAGCNTMEGLGRDVKSAGDSLSDAASETKENL